MWQIYNINVLYMLYIFADSSTIDALLQSSFKVQEPRRGDITKDRVGKKHRPDSGHCFCQQC